METELLDLMKNRRSLYALGKNVDLSHSDIVKLVTGVLKYTPTAFNNQTVRASIMFGKDHDQVWDLILEATKKITPDEKQLAQTEKRIQMFKAAYGTILFFTDDGVVDQFKKQFAMAADFFHDWSEQAMGTANAAIWTALEENKIGANLQHLNYASKLLQDHFNLPKNWTLKAEMPFGSIEGPAGKKEFMKDEDRIKVFDD